jgi:hypothetical protein
MITDDNKSFSFFLFCIYINRQYVYDSTNQTGKRKACFSSSGSRYSYGQSRSVGQAVGDVVFMHDGPLILQLHFLSSMDVECTNSCMFQVFQI